MEHREIPQEEREISFDELQVFVNNPALDLPQKRRDLSNVGNIAWLTRNIWIRNEVPLGMLDALKKLLKEKTEK